MLHPQSPPTLLMQSTEPTYCTAKYARHTSSVSQVLPHRNLRFWLAPPLTVSPSLVATYPAGALRLPQPIRQPCLTPVSPPSLHNITPARHNPHGVQTCKYASPQRAALH